MSNYLLIHRWNVSFVELPSCLQDICISTSQGASHYIPNWNHSLTQRNFAPYFFSRLIVLLTHLFSPWFFSLSSPPISYWSPSFTCTSFNNYQISYLVSNTKISIMAWAVSHRSFSKVLLFTLTISSLLSSYLAAFFCLFKIFYIFLTPT